MAKKKATKSARATKSIVKKSAVKKGAAKKSAAKKSAAKKSTAKKGARAVKPRPRAKIDPNAPKPQADPDAELTATQLRTLQRQLIEERDNRLTALKRHVGEATEDSGRTGDEADVASLHANQAYLLRVADKEQKLLREIRHALHKMETEEYGVCEGSGEPISYKRLQLRPWTRYSVRYKEELEREKAQRSR